MNLDKINSFNRRFCLHLNEYAVINKEVNAMSSRRLPGEHGIEYPFAFKWDSFLGERDHYRIAILTFGAKSSECVMDIEEYTIEFEGEISFDDVILGQTLDKGGTGTMDS